METVCIYHSIDLDGWMSAAIVKHWWLENSTKGAVTGGIFNGKDILVDVIKEDSILFIGYNYGQPIPDLSEYDEVIMCDISFKDKNNTAQPMINLYEEFKTLGKEIHYIDHHISAFNDIKLVSENGDIPFLGLQDIHYSACELTWKYFFPNEDMPEIVRLLGRYDCFGHKGTDEETKVLEFQYGARQCISNYEEAYDYLLKSFEGIIEYDYVGQHTIENIIHNSGRIIYQYLCTEAKQVYKNGFEIELNVINKIPDIKELGFKNASNQRNYKFICINRERFNPINFGIDYHKDGYDGAACFYLNADKKWSFSLYNDNGLVDCSQIAKQYGGGGHKGAAGMIVDLETFKSIVQL